MTASNVHTQAYEAILHSVAAFTADPVRFDYQGYVAVCKNHSVEAAIVSRIAQEEGMEDIFKYVSFSYPSALGRGVALLLSRNFACSILLLLSLRAVGKGPSVFQGLGKPSLVFPSKAK